MPRWWRRPSAPTGMASAAAAGCCGRRARRGLAGAACGASAGAFGALAGAACGCSAGAFGAAGLAALGRGLGRLRLRGRSLGRGARLLCRGLLGRGPFRRATGRRRGRARRRARAGATRRRLGATGGRPRRHHGARTFGLALRARGDLEWRPVGLEDPALTRLRGARGALCSRGRARRARGTGLTRARRARGGALPGRGRSGWSRRSGRGRTVAAERAQRLGLVDGRCGGRHVDAGGAQLEQHVAGGHAAFLGDLMYALLCHQPVDSTRSEGTETERRNARPRARRRIAVARQSGPQTYAPRPGSVAGGSATTRSPLSARRRSSALGAMRPQPTQRRVGTWPLVGPMGCAPRPARARRRPARRARPPRAPARGRHP